jgi:hypothetical protein
MLLTVLDGTAKPMPTLPPPPFAVSICELTPITRPLRVDQRPAGVAAVDRRVGLDHVVDRVVVGRAHLALERADDARGDRPLEPERVSDRDDGVADPDDVRVCEARAA